MPATVRDILLTIRAKEEASRSLNNVAASMRRAQTQAAQASARARAGALRAQALQASARAEMLASFKAQQRINGATKAQIALTEQQIKNERGRAKSLRNDASAIEKSANAMADADKKATRLTGSLGSVGQVAQIAGLGLAAMGAAGVLAMGNTIAVAAEWDRQVRLTWTQVDKRFKPSLEELGDIGLRVANKVAVPFEKVQEALFDVFSSTEANLPEAEKLLESFSKAAVAGQTDVQTASRATIGLMNAYKVPLKDVNKILDIQFQLVQEGVGTYEEWSQRIGLVTPSAVRAGQSIETMAAALATSTRLGTSAARSGTAVSRAFDAMSNPKTEEALAKINVRVRDAKGNFRPLVDVMTDWRKELEKMPKEDRVKSILETLKGAGSTIEARRFLQNILLTKGGLELFQDQIKEFSTDKGAFERAYNEMANSVSAKTQQLKNSWMTLKLVLGQALLPIFSRVVDGLKRLIDLFNQLPKGTQQTIAKFILFGSIFAIIAGAITIAVAAFVAFGAVIAAAGAALLPVMGVMTLIGAVIALVVAGITALGIAFGIAYAKSAPFREMIGAIGEVFWGLFGVLREAAASVGAAFNSTILPALKQLWSVLETQVFPAVAKFAGWFRDIVIPILKQGAQAFGQGLKPGMQTVANVIRDQIIPVIKKLVQWFKENEGAIKRVIVEIAKIIRASLILAGVFGGGFISTVAKVVGWMFRMTAAAVKGAWALGVIVVGNVKKAITFFRVLYQMVQNAVKAFISMATKVIATITRMVGRIKETLSNTGSMLVQAGKNLVQGFINGIGSMVGAVVSKAKGMASSAVSAAKNALGISSPSKVFKDIGRNVVEGFVKGVLDDKDKILSTMRSLKDAILKSIAGADISKAAKKRMNAKWTRRLEIAQQKLLRLDNQRTKVAAALEAAESRYNDLLEKRKSLFESVQGAIMQSGDLTTLDDEQKKTVSGVVGGLKERLDAVKQFQANLETLRKKGLDKQVLADLAAKGVEGAGDLVKTLATAQVGDIKRINEYEKQIRSIADKTGNQVADTMYKQGLAAAKGLVDGLKSQMKSIEAVMTQIANALVKQIKKELGIKSPSKVLAAIGKDTAQGYINGYLQRMSAENANLARASLFTPASARVGSGYDMTAYGQPSSTKVYNNTWNITTNEIDPRKNAAELGWLLESRLS